MVRSIWRLMFGPAPQAASTESKPDFALRPSDSVNAIFANLNAESRRRRSVQVRDRRAIEDWLFGKHRWDDKRSFERAASAVDGAAYRDGVPPEWALNVVRAFRKEFELAQEAEATAAALRARRTQDELEDLYARTRKRITSP